MSTSCTGCASQTQQLLAPKTPDSFENPNPSPTYLPFPTVCIPPHCLFPSHPRPAWHGLHAQGPIPTPFNISEPLLADSSFPFSSVFPVSYLQTAFTNITTRQLQSQISTMHLRYRHNNMSPSPTGVSPSAQPPRPPLEHSTPLSSPESFTSHHNMHNIHNKYLRRLQTVMN